MAPIAGFVFLSRRGHVVTRAQERVRTLLQVWDDAEQAVWLAGAAGGRRHAVALAALFSRRLQAAARAGAAPTVRVRLPAACVADVPEEKSEAAANRQRQLAALRAAEAAEAAAEEHDGLLDRLGAFVGGLFARGDACGDGGASATAAAATGEAAEEEPEEEEEAAEEAAEEAMAPAAAGADNGDMPRAREWRHAPPPLTGGLTSWGLLWGDEPAGSAAAAPAAAAPAAAAPAATPTAAPAAAPPPRRPPRRPRAGLAAPFTPGMDPKLAARLAAQHQKASGTEIATVSSAEDAPRRLRPRLRADVRKGEGGERDARGGGRRTARGASGRRRRRARRWRG